MNSQGNRIWTPEQMEVARMLREEQQASNGKLGSTRGGNHSKNRRGGSIATSSTRGRRSGVPFTQSSENRGRRFDSSFGSGVDRGRAIGVPYTVGPSTPSPITKPISPNRTRNSISIHPIANSTHRSPSPLRLRESILVEKPVEKSIARMGTIPSIPSQGLQTSNTELVASASGFGGHVFETLARGPQEPPCQLQSGTPFSQAPRSMVNEPQASSRHVRRNISIGSAMDLDEPAGGLSLLDSAVPEEFQSQMTQAITPGQKRPTKKLQGLADSMWNPANENVRPKDQECPDSPSRLGPNLQKGIYASSWAPWNQPVRKY